MDELTPEQLEQIEKILRALKVSLLDELDQSSAAAQPVELDQARVGRVSRIDAIQQQQMAAASREAKQHRLALVRQALDRLAEGEYGVCMKCEEPIDPKRLMARPEAAYCVQCAGGKKRH